MSIWNWIHEYAEEAADNGDEQRMELLNLTHRASTYGKEEPDLNLASLMEGRALATHLNEPWWILFFDHWRLQVLLNYKRDYRDVLDIAVRAALEARKPAYANFPQRICLHEDLITAYLGVDPLGHAQVISDAMDYMDQEMPEDVECRFCAVSCRADFALARNDLDGVEKYARMTLQMADEYWNPSTGEHHSASACGHLCTVAYRRGDFDQLQEWADMGEDLNRRREEDLALATHMLWQALLARQQGDEDRGKRLRHRALSRVKRVRSTPSGDYYDALAAYHEAAGELDKAIRVRERELARITGKGRTHEECQCHLKRCRLLSQLGELNEEALMEARAVANQLRNPGPVLEELEQLKS